LKDDHTMEAVANRLTSMGVAFQRGGGQMDSAVVPPQMMARIKALPPGEPFLVPENGMVTVAVVTDAKPAPLLGANARPIAAQLMRSAEMGKILDQRLKTERDAAKIDYQTGFAPPKVAAGPKAAPAKP
jgi:hypothetical protein